MLSEDQAFGDVDRRGETFRGDGEHLDVIDWIELEWKDGSDGKGGKSEIPFLNETSSRTKLLALLLHHSPHLLQLLAQSLSF